MCLYIIGVAQAVVHVDDRVPVSYTHLDVYKRQGYIFPIFGRKLPLGIYCRASEEG